MRGFTDETTPHQLRFQCFGVIVRVCASSPDVLERIERTLPVDRRESDEILGAHRVGIVSEDDGTFSVYNSATRVSEGGGLELALVTLEGQINSYISIHAPGFVFVRAGVVGYEGRAIVIPGDSFTGKTTLVNALVDAGAVYYADQFAPIDGEGRVHSFPGAGAPDSARVMAESNGLPDGDARPPLPVGLVVSTYFSPGADWSPERVSGGAAALALLADTVTVTTRPDEALKAVTRALADAVFLKGERGEAEPVARWLLEQIAAPAAD